MREFEVVGETVVLPVAHATFPARCLGCGNAATTQVELYRQRGIDLILHRHIRTVKLPVPACGVCRRRKTILWFAGWAPLLVVVAWWLVRGPLGSRQLSASDLDLLLWAALTAFLLGFYGARRLGDRQGFGAWIDDMTPLGDAVRIRFRDVRDALETADLSRRHAGLEAAAAFGASSSTVAPLSVSPGGRIDLRYSLARVGVRALAPAALLAVAWSLREFGGADYPILRWAALALAAYLASRFFDRRVRLALDSEGFTYRPWGVRKIAWSEVESVRLVNDQLNWFLDVRPRAPEMFAARLPFLERISGTFLNSTRPRFSVDLTMLEGEREAIFAAVSQRVSPLEA